MQLHHQAAHFATRTIALDGPVDRQRLVAFLTDPPPGLLRVKGFVELLDMPGRPHVVQAVGRMWSIEPAAGIGPAAPPENGLVLIGLADQARIWQAAVLTALPETRPGPD